MDLQGTCRHACTHASGAVVLLRHQLAFEQVAGSLPHLRVVTGVVQWQQHIGRQDQVCHWVLQVWGEEVAPVFADNAVACQLEDECLDAHNGLQRTATSPSNCLHACTKAGSAAKHSFAALPRGPSRNTGRAYLAILRDMSDACHNGEGAAHQEGARVRQDERQRI